MRLAPRIEQGARIAGMAESFLQGQLRRIRALTERMSRVHAYAEQTCEACVARRSENPLASARDYRMISSIADEPATHTDPPSGPARRRRRRRR